MFPLLIGLRSVAVLLQCYVVLVRAQPPTCYHIDGAVADPEKNVPCNADVTGEGDSHSACCNSENQHACIPSGLCLNTLSRQNDRLIWATGCTDPTMKDPSCPQRCLDRDIGNARLMFCNATHYCRLDWDTEIGTEECCRDSTRFQSSIGVVINQLGIKASTPSSSPLESLSPAPTGCTDEVEDRVPATILSGMVTGMVVLGAALSAALAGVAYTYWGKRRLMQAYIELKDEKAALEGLYRQLWPRPPPNTAELAHYGLGNPLESPEGRLELSQAVPELSGSPISDHEISPRSIYPQGKSPGGGP